MAKKDKEPEISVSDKVRGGLIVMLKRLGLLVSLVALGYVGWLMMAKGNPHRQFETIEQTMEAYTQFVMGYQSSQLVLPNPRDVELFLGFFDRPSREFFDQNFEEMARRRLVLDPERFETAGRDGRRGHAMLFLLNYPPMGGMVRLAERRPLEGEREEVIVMTARHGRRTVIFRRDGGNWRMESFAGVIPEVQALLSAPAGAQ